MSDFFVKLSSLMRPPESSVKICEITEEITEETTEETTEKVLPKEVINTPKEKPEDSLFPGETFLDIPQTTEESPEEKPKEECPENGFCEPSTQDLKTADQQEEKEEKRQAKRLKKQEQREKRKQKKEKKKRRKEKGEQGKEESVVVTSDLPKKDKSPTFFAFVQPQLQGLMSKTPTEVPGTPKVIQVPTPKSDIYPWLISTASSSASTSLEFYHTLEPSPKLQSFVRSIIEQIAEDKYLVEERILLSRFRYFEQEIKNSNLFSVEFKRDYLQSQLEDYMSVVEQAEEDFERRERASKQNEILQMMRSNHLSDESFFERWIVLDS